MARTFKLEIVTPERTLFSEEVTSLIVPAENGYLGVLAGHAPLLAALRPGEILIRREKGDVRYATSGGFLEVTPKKASILSESSEPIEEIDAARAEKARARAAERLKSAAKDVDRTRAEAALERADNRLSLRKKYGR